MILPNVRMSFGEEEIDDLLRVLDEAGSGGEERWERMLRQEGPDALLDHPTTLERILDRSGIDLLSPRLVLYVLIRRTLLETGVESREIADYTTALVAEFGTRDRSRRVEPGGEREYRYLVEILEEITEAEGRRAFLLQAHLGNFALWLAGLFPDHIAAREHRRGGPGLDYYEELGRAGYRMASEAPQARRRSLDGLFRGAADSFVPLRRSLNRLSDRLLFPSSSVPVERLLRQARDGFREGRHH